MTPEQEKRFCELLELDRDGQKNARVFNQAFEDALERADRLRAHANEMLKRVREAEELVVKAEKERDSVREEAKKTKQALVNFIDGLKEQTP